MILLTRDDLAALYPRAPNARLDAFLKNHLHDFKIAEIKTPNRASFFLAQMGHESNGLTVVEENLNYKTDQLRKTWPSRFRSNAKAIQYAHNPKALGDFVYSNRNGNGEDEGYKYRGRGYLQTTGKNNYSTVGKMVGLDLVAKPELLATPEFALLGACATWKLLGLNASADKSDFKGNTKRLNGGLIGLADRQAWLAKARPIGARAHIRAVQQRMRDLCRYEVGMADGIAGTRLTAALAGFQKDEGLPVNGKLTQATLDALADAKPRKVPEQRKEATVEDIADDRVVKVATKSKAASWVATAGGGAWGASEIIDKADVISEKAEKAKTLWETIEAPLSAIGNLVANHPVPFLIAAGGLVLLYIVHRFNHAALRNYQTGKTA